MVRAVLTTSLPPFWRPRPARRPDRSRSCAGLRLRVSFYLPPSHILVPLFCSQKPLP
jgi:hypothetical protein